MVKRYLLPALRILFGVVFIVASIDKIHNPEAFARIVANYRMLPLPLVAPVALTLPWIEVMAGLALIINWCSKGAVILLNALLVVFMAALGFNVVRGVDVACGCFTTSTEGSGMFQSLLRDIPLLLVGLYLAWRILLNNQRQRYNRRRD